VRPDTKKNTLKVVLSIGLSWLRYLRTGFGYLRAGLGFGIYVRSWNMSIPTASDLLRPFV